MMNSMTPKLLAVLIGSLGLVAAGAPNSLAAEPQSDATPLAGERPDQKRICIEKTPEGDKPYTCGESPRGKILEHSHARPLPASSSSEREGAEFASLPPSSLTTEERRIIMENVAPKDAPQATMTLQDSIGGTNFASGRAELTQEGVKTLDAIVEKVRGKKNIRFEVQGHTDNQRISARLRSTYPDNMALSMARSLTVAGYIKKKLGLMAQDFTAAGYGESRPIGDNRTPEGMAKNRRTELRIWFQEPVVAQSAVPKAVEVVTKRDACAPGEGLKGGQAFSISVDGVPMKTDTKQVEADRQRCVDVALEKGEIQIKYDPLNVSPALNVWSAATPLAGKPLEFGTYANYIWWVKKAEIRVFQKGVQTQEAPFAVLPVAGIGGFVTWQPPQNTPAELAYLLRVYDDKGRFDETALKPLRILDRSVPLDDKAKDSEERLVGYGESSLKLRNIKASGGTVTVSGSNVAAGQTVTALGAVIPVDAKGKFATRQILPAGPHSVEVAVRNAQGQGPTYRRNLNIADKDWFYFAFADITAGRDRTNGPAALVTTDLQHYNNETWVDGRGAFYLKGKIRGDYILTAGADTQEQPLGKLLTDFQAKDPNYLLRRIDPNRYYPVYGDDSTIAEDMPTQGKFFVKLAKDDTSVMWGNFQTSWTGTELTNYSRGLYGANAVVNSDATTRYGEKKTSLNVFVAEPGTLQSREEFRGTGGSMYYLHHLDLTQGSERLWVEIRDKDSGQVIERKPLVFGQDYEFNYLQGRITLSAPLPSVTDGSTLVQTSTLNGNPVYLIATYEYAPGVSQIHTSAYGLRASHWLNDNIRLGMTRYHQGETTSEQDLKGLDATLRYKPGTFIRAEVARSKGAGSDNLTSITGGLSFNQSRPSGADAGARRVEVAADLSDVSASMKGKVSAYVQSVDAGYSGPGVSTGITGEAIVKRGASAVVPIGTSTEVAIKTDSRNSSSQTAKANEVAVRQKLGTEWGVSAGLRGDDRSNGITNASPTLSQSGARNDLIVRVDYNPLADGEKEKAAAKASAPQPAGALPGVGAQGAAGSTSKPESGPASALVPAPNKAQTASLGQPFDPAVSAGVAANRDPGLKYKPWNAYGFVQDTVSRSGNRDANDRGGVGLGYQINDRLRLGTEVSGGTGGTGGRVSADYRVDDRSNVYMAYTMETEQADTNYRGRQGTLSSGSRYRVSDQVGIFGESRWTNGAGPQSLTNAFGVDLAPNDRWTLGTKVEVGSVSDPLAGDLRRRALGLSTAYKYEKVKFASSVEYRNEATNTNGTVAGTSTPSTGAGISSRVVWLMKNSLGYQVDPAWRLLGKYNFSRSKSSQGAFYDGDYTEFVAGAAYRPINNDRWNTLFKYTYFYNLPSAGQVDNLIGSNAILDYTQKSHVLTVDTIYDVRPWISVGVKYGFRWGDLRSSKTVGDWFSSKADLLVLRSDLHFTKEWDGLVELRRLRAQEAGDARSGFLVGVYRHVSEHAKIGVGYNFTTFSDNLTDLSYRSRGWFLNALGSY